jgi:DNA-binding transcriptional LysR family regulator
MQIDDLKIVIKTAELGSITGAATNLNIQVARASAAIKRVEGELGFELFIRSTRQLRLSTQGEQYIPQCIQALETLNNAQQNVLTNQTTIKGELRLTTSSDLGRNIILPWLDNLTDEHNELRLKLILNDHDLDFYRDSVDIALRYGSPTDSNMYGFKICDVPRVLCASPEYLSKHVAPTHPKELNLHTGLFYQLSGIVYDTWKFTHKTHNYSIKMTGDRTANDGDLVRRWCVAGKGLAVKSLLDMSTDLLNGNAEIVMPEYKPTPTELWLICPSRQSINPMVRLLRNELTLQCKQLLADLTKANIYIPN